MRTDVYKLIANNCWQDVTSWFQSLGGMTFQLEHWAQPNEFCK